MEGINEIDTNTLRNWLAAGKEVLIIDVRPAQEREEWFIPGSIHFDVYDQLKANALDIFKDMELNQTIPVVTVCAGGKTSLLAANILQQQGFEVYSLKGGMKAWSLSWNTAEISFPDFKVIQLRRTGKGCLSYLIATGGEAIVVDASLPVEVYQEILQKQNLRLKYVIETHIHADHLSRSKQLAEMNEVSLHLPMPNQVNFDFIPIDATTVLALGQIRIQAIHTPGHTLESTCYLVNDQVLLTGDTLFINGVGRPDLKADIDEAQLRSVMLYQSLRIILALPEEIIMIPGHISQPINFDNTVIQTTIGIVKNNIIFRFSEEDFIETILLRIPPVPTNYLSIVEKNLKGDFSEINSVELEAGPNRCAIS
ncbi:MBL fold metallo-hydrolase [Pedobacter sp. PAMC26386]|nr:MBL fold metallo-hydrolase [Pedobacter sp. PAMC26386]